MNKIITTTIQNEGNQRTQPKTTRRMYKTSLKLSDQGPVVRRLISANPGLNFNPVSILLCSKAVLR